MIKMLEPGTNETSCPMMLAMYVLPCRLDTAAQTKRYFGLLIAFIIAFCEGRAAIPSKSKYSFTGSFRNLVSDCKSKISSETMSCRLTCTAMF